MILSIKAVSFKKLMYASNQKEDSAALKHKNSKATFSPFRKATQKGLLCLNSAGV